MHSVQDKPYSIFRPELNALPENPGLPIYLRSTGSGVRTREYAEHGETGVKNFVQFFWGVEGEGEFFHPGIGTGVSRLRPGWAFYRLPLEAHQFRSCTAIWTYRWITFDGPLARDFMLAYDYPRECFPAAPCPHELFANLYNLLLIRTPLCWRLTLAGIGQLLAQAGGAGDAENDDTAMAAINLCNERFHTADLDVNSLAAELGIGRTTLLRAFKRKMGQSPSAYLSQVRLQAALSMLENTSRPLKEIARECGFRDVNYFCRFMKANTGHRPSELREGRALA